LADFLFRKDQMAGKKISELMDIWAAYQQFTETEPGQGPPFASAQDLYDTIDSTEIGSVSWQAFSVQFDGPIAEDSTFPQWKTKSYDVWFRDPLKIAEAQIGNKDFGREMNFAPKRVFSRAGRRQYTDFMSGNWAWQQAVCYITYVFEPPIDAMNTGCNCSRSRDTWFDVCARHPWQ
jgi:Plavaka transposase